MLNGRRVSEGEKIGVVSNYLDHPNGTSRHLHFDVQVFTRDGWLWVNPYVTLISAYERLIRGRGREIGPDAAAPARRRARPAGRTSSVPTPRETARTEPMTLPRQPFAAPRRDRPGSWSAQGVQNCRRAAAEWPVPRARRLLPRP